ncbi:hypothetical protein NEOKW01_0381 [Nematocida sp. AWRm80]|nr:hypothetical protein NEOKW01_0381 [Nematocida sp. AWRm80]
MDRKRLRECVIRGNKEKSISFKRVHNDSIRVNEYSLCTGLEDTSRQALEVQRRYKRDLREKVLPAKNKPVYRETNQLSTKANNDRIDNPTESISTKLKEYLPEIVRALKESKGVFIKGGTGIGKTTEMPRLLLERLDLK